MTATADMAGHAPDPSARHWRTVRAIARAHRETLPGHAAHARLRHVRQRGTMLDMVKSKRVALSLTVSANAAQCLKERAAREGHRYHLAFAASLLERAVEVPAAGTGRGDWLSDMGALARVFGGKVSIDGDRVTVTLESGSKEPALVWLQSRVMANHPPPDGVVFMVKIEGAG